ncbi:MAG TPA: CRISPR system precrRNA processing endoribonuclease RAMP protein Cas6 [Geobacteraceae bacterium]
MDLNFVRLIATLRLENDNVDRYVLFDLRPYFEEAFRQAAGCGGEGGSCDCSYHQAFSQPLSVDPAALKRYQKPSLPFAFSVSPLPEPPNRMATVELGLTLVGPAVNFVATYVDALNGMLASPDLHRRCAASLMKVESAGCDGCRSLVFAPKEGVALDRLSSLSLQGLREASVLAPDTVTLAIATPMLILSEGRSLREFSFSSFMRALFRRVSSMAYYYGTEEDIDYKWLAGQSREVECAHADFRWVEWGRKLYGVVGTGTFRGDLTDFHPFLLAGEYLQVGKGAPFGHGRFMLRRNV